MSEEKRGRGRPKTLPDEIVHTTLRLSKTAHRQVQAAAGLRGVPVGTFAADAITAAAVDVLTRMGVDLNALGDDVIVQPQSGNAKKSRKTEK